jgi:hypothetical protein
MRAESRQAEHQERERGDKTSLLLHREERSSISVHSLRQLKKRHLDQDIARR